MLWLGAFIWGSLSVGFVLPIEHFISDIFAGNTFLAGEGYPSIWVVLMWAIAEEVTKFSPLLLLKSKIKSENIVKYGVVTAWGFALLENVIFFLGSDLASISARFLLANPLHIIASFIASMCWYNERTWKGALKGILLASFVHLLFNDWINSSLEDPFFSNLWLMLIISLLFAWILFKARKGRLEKPAKIEYKFLRWLWASFLAITYTAFTSLVGVEMFKDETMSKTEALIGLVVFIVISLLVLWIIWFSISFIRRKYFSKKSAILG